MRRSRFEPHWAVSCLLLVVLAPLLLYVGWCWGWLGRHSLPLQYLLQCNCPTSSEAARYSDRVDVLVSACRIAAIDVSPSGRFLYVRPHDPQPEQYMVDFTTGAIESTPTSHYFAFMSDDLLLVFPRGADRYLLDLQSGAPLVLVKLLPHRLPGGELDDDTADPTVLLPLLRSTDKLFVYGRSLIIVEGQSAVAGSAGNFLAEEVQWLGADQNGALWRQFLDANQLSYTISSPPDNSEWPSHSGRLIARRDGIYLRETGERIVENVSLPKYGYLVPAGWLAGDRGLVLHAGGPYLFETRGLVSLRLGHVQQPVLLLKVPPEYFP